MSAVSDDIARRQLAARPPEIEEWLNGRAIHPLSDRLTTALAPTGITPNMVSAFGVIASAGAGIFYAMPGWPVATVIAFLFHLGWHVFDGSDGDLARRTGKTSPSGEIVDGICDYLSHVFVYGFLAWVLSQQLGIWAWVIALAAGLSRAVQANHYESARRTYQWWVYGHPWMRQSHADAPLPPSGFARFGARLARSYLAVSEWASADDSAVVAHHDRLMGGPKAQAARDLYATEYLRIVKRASKLGALHETQAIFASMLLAPPILGLFFAAPFALSPLPVFLYELVGLNGLMAWSIVRQRRANARLAKAFAALG